jgi:hypothetical protein
LVGPHRDDVCFLADGVDLRPYGSRGQNRTAMISMRLAQAEWIRRRTTEWPVLLLDETLAELDEARRRDVLERVSGAPQAILTAADLKLFPPSFSQTASVWELAAGRESNGDELIQFQPSYQLPVSRPDLPIDKRWRGTGHWIGLQRPPCGHAGPAG